MPVCATPGRKPEDRFSRDASQNFKSGGPGEGIPFVSKERLDGIWCALFVPILCCLFKFYAF